MNNWSVLEAPKAPRKFFLPLSTRYNEIFENRVCPPNNFCWGGMPPQKSHIGGACPPNRDFLFSPLLLPHPSLKRVYFMDKLFW